jgi:predicted AlkP superfamily pyrophosphatase or phosphodiesterase
MLTDGYNFDGTQNPVVQRQGDAPSTAPVLSVSNFYGAHGYDPNIKDMSALFVAAGPDIGKGKLDLVHNIDLAPTFDKILKVQRDATVEGKALKNILQ